MKNISQGVFNAFILHEDQWTVDNLKILLSKPSAVATEQHQTLEKKEYKE
jgi:hypothetical protein